MATSVTRFECHIPVPVDGSSESSSVNTFMDNVKNLTTCVQDTCYVNISGVATYCYRIYGFLLSSQLSTALGYLNSLNASLGSSILCVTEAANSQP